MSPRELLRRFPNASKAVLEANKADYGSGIPDLPQGTLTVKNCTVVEGSYLAQTKLISITIEGQIRGGKNNMIVTKKGKHIPRKEWAKWRDEAVAQVQMQLPGNWEPISTPTSIRMEYISGDHRRRDMPAIIDAIFHVLEKAGFCEDDTNLWITQSIRSYDKENPRATISVLYP